MARCLGASGGFGEPQNSPPEEPNPTLVASGGAETVSGGRSRSYGVNSGACGIPSRTQGRRVSSSVFSSELASGWFISENCGLIDTEVKNTVQNGQYNAARGGGEKLNVVE